MEKFIERLGMMSLIMIVLLIFIMPNLFSSIQSSTVVDALDAFRKSLDPTGVLNWDTRPCCADPCKWSYLRCDDGIVTEINLVHINLSGDLSAIGQLASLVGLTHLILSNNSLTGSIPHEVGNLNTNLQSFDVSNNKLNGSIPCEMGNLTKLRFLLLGNNKFNNILPKSLCKVAVLGLQNNNGLEKSCNNSSASTETTSC